ncbi:MAG: 50S ribosomal protein L29 [Chlamydiales bacterium]|nr:50S ribosomal protein L29 [Chlamydiales bacterium]
MSKASAYRDQSIEELEAKQADLLKELFELKCQLSLEKKIDKPHLLREHRRERARIQTVLREKRVS